MMRSRKTDAANVERAIETIYRNAQSQSQLVADLLDVSRIISGKLRLDVRTVDLLSIVNAALDSIRPAADAKGIRLQSILIRRLVQSRRRRSAATDCLEPVD